MYTCVSKKIEYQTQLRHAQLQNSLASKAADIQIFEKLMKFKLRSRTKAFFFKENIVNPAFQKYTQSFCVCLNFLT